MAIELSEGDIGKKIRIRRNNEVMDWYLVDIGPDDYGEVTYRFKKQINDPEGKLINLRKIWFTWGHATLERLQPPAAAAGPAPMNVNDDNFPMDGGRRRRNRKTKRRHMKKRKSRRSRR